MDRTWACRVIAPPTEGVFHVPAASPEEAAQELLEQRLDLGLKITPYYNLRAEGKEDPAWGPGRSVYFCRVSVDGQDMVARFYTSGIVRRGGIPPRNILPLAEALKGLARALDYHHDPQTLLDAWEYEEKEWTPRFSTPRPPCTWTPA